jgi:hypothetical protein
MTSKKGTEWPLAHASQSTTLSSCQGEKCTRADGNWQAVAVARARAHRREAEAAERGGGAALERLDDLARGRRKDAVRARQRAVGPHVGERAAHLCGLEAALDAQVRDERAAVDRDALPQVCVRVAAAAAAAAAARRRAVLRGGEEGRRGARREGGVGSPSSSRGARDDARGVSRPPR